MDGFWLEIPREPLRYGYIYCIMARREIIEFKGVKYYRYPDSPKRTHRVYFQRQGKQLHRAIWEDANGPIPDGFEVHHKDGNPLNNSVDNLEALPRSRHKAESARARRYWEFVCSWCGAVFVKQSNLAGENHFCSSKCKQAWRYANKSDMRDKVCAECGITFSVYISNWYTQKHCSRSCATRASNRRRREAAS